MQPALFDSPFTLPRCGEETMRPWRSADSLRMRPFGSVQWCSKNFMLVRPTATVKL